MTNFKIDGIDVQAKEDETILNVARRLSMYIPTMCYLEKTTPSASCRLCVVEVKGLDGAILSCQTKPTEGIEVVLNSDNLQNNRENIMRLYDVNHPLECGVCDKSGACDLQNKTLELNVDKQLFSAKDQSRKIEQWGLINYDHNLCIMCEKCTHTCNEIIGDDALDLRFGGYNSSIVPKNADYLDCTFCGECIAVCPVGALISSDFQYTSNAWELQKIPSTCAHCSAGCALEYEVKQTSSIENKADIYRVGNNYEYNTLCGAGRFAYDFDNKNTTKDLDEFSNAIDSFKKADTIEFDSIISNEEAYILQALKEKLGVKLVNKDAYAYQSFLRAYQSASGKLLYSGDLENIKNSDQVIVIGSRIATDNPAVRYHLTMAVKRNKANIIYFHPIEDKLMQNVVSDFIKYEAGSEEGVVALLAKVLIDENIVTNKTVKDFLSNLDEGNLSAQSNVGEEELALLAKKQLRAKVSTLIIGQDILGHRNANNIAKLVALIEKYTIYNVVIVPSKTNTLGVSLICDLDEKAKGYTVGYNIKADYTLSALGDGDLDMPALNQQEGTLTSLDKRVTPLNVAVPFGGFTLNDIANALGLYAKNTINYTVNLGEINGFKAISFDDLENFYSDLGEDIRGYVLNNINLDETTFKLEDVEELPSFDGSVVYACEPVLEFNQFTHKSHQLKNQDVLLVGSAQFALASKINDGDKVKFEIDGTEYERIFKLDSELKGTIALNHTFDKENDASLYRFSQVKINKSEV
jgi:NADH-quinone oxidoreductase subunit G